MSEQFDPYYTWLGIPPEEQPPDHYRLLGIRKFESNQEVISNAIDQRMSHIRSFQTGKRSAQSQELLNVLSRASGCLCNLEKKEVYDHELKQKDAPQRPKPNANVPRAKPLAAAPPPRPVAAPPPGGALSPEFDPFGPLPTGQTGSGAWPSPIVATSKPKPKAARSPLLAGGLVAAGLSIGLVILVGGAVLWALFGGGGSAKPPKSGDVSVKPSEPESSKVEVPTKPEPDKGDVKPSDGTPANDTQLEPAKPRTEIGATNSVALVKPSDPSRAIGGEKPSTPSTPPQPPASIASTVQPPAKGFALQFGGKQYVELQNSASIASWNKPGTAEIWMRWSPDGKEHSLMGTYWRPAGAPSFAGDGWALRIDDTKGQGALNRHWTDPVQRGVGYGGPAGVVPRDDRWHHVAYSHDESGLDVSVDGKCERFKGVWPLPPAVEGTNFFLGSPDVNNQRMHFAGEICAVRLSSTKRYTKDFEPPATFDKDDFTVALLDFSKITPDSIRDLSGKGRHGKIMGARWVRTTTGKMLPQPDTTPAAVRANPQDYALAPVPALPTGNRLAVPGPAEQTKARAEMRSLYKQEFAKAAKPAEKLALANKLEFLARDPKEPPTLRYVLFDEARTLKLASGDVASALDNVDHMLQAFDADPWKTRLATLKKGVETADTPDERRRLVQAAMARCQLALLEDQIDPADDLAKTALAVAGRLGDAKLRVAARSLQSRTNAAQRQVEAAKHAQEQLQSQPDDPQANLVCGKFACLIKHDWNTGLPYLAKAEDKPLKAVAELELGDPRESEKQAAVADAWWDIAQSATGHEKASMLERARHWYGRSLGTVGGLTKLRVQKRIDEIAALLSR